MPATTVGSVTVPDETFTATSFAYLNELKQNMRDIPQPFAEDMLKMGVKSVEGGAMISIPYEMENHSLPTRVRSGSAYGSYRTWAQPTMKSGQETWAYVVQPCFISRYEKNQNRGKHQQIDIAKGRVKNVYSHLLRQLQAAILLGSVASGSHTGTDQWEDFLSVNGTDYATGLIEEDSSGGNTVHGVSRSSYPATTHPLFHNLAFDVANNASTNLLDRAVNCQTKMQVRGISAMGGSFRWYCSETFVQNLAKILRAGLQYTTMKAGDEQMALPIFLGKPLRAVEALPYQGANSATYKWSCLGITWKEGLALHAQSGNILDMDPWATIPMTVGVQGTLFHLNAQTILEKPGLNILFHRAETYS
jgi:hypothetical protein